MTLENYINILTLIGLGIFFHFLIYLIIQKIFSSSKLQVLASFLLSLVYTISIFTFTKGFELLALGIAMVGVWFFFVVILLYKIIKYFKGKLA